MFDVIYTPMFDFVNLVLI